MPSGLSELPDSAAPFDRKLALHHAGDEPEVLRAVLELFLDQVSDRVGRLEAALGQGDAEALERAAHSLKGTAATLALGRVRELADALEQMGATERTAGAQERLVELREALDDVLPALRAALAVPTG